MLKNISPVISPELLKILMEMGHSDEIVIGDGNFPKQEIWLHIKETAIWVLMQVPPQPKLHW